MDNPSIAVTLSYQRTSQALYNPSTFKKTKPSVLDLFFMEQPQGQMSIDLVDPGIKSDIDIVEKAFGELDDKPIEEILNPKAFY